VDTFKRSAEVYDPTEENWVNDRRVSGEWNVAMGMVESLSLPENGALRGERLLVMYLASPLRRQCRP